MSFVVVNLKNRVDRNINQPATHQLAQVVVSNVEENLTHSCTKQHITAVYNLVGNYWRRNNAAEASWSVVYFIGSARRSADCCIVEVITTKTTSLISILPLYLQYHTIQYSRPIPHQQSYLAKWTRDLTTTPAADFRQQCPGYRANPMQCEPPWWTIRTGFLLVLGECPTAVTIRVN